MLRQREVGEAAGDKSSWHKNEKRNGVAHAHLRPFTPARADFLRQDQRMPRSRACAPTPAARVILSPVFWR